MPSTQKGFSSWIILFGILLICGSVIGGSYYLKENTKLFGRSDTLPEVFKEIERVASQQPLASTSVNNKKLGKLGIPQQTQKCAGTFLYYENKNTGLWGYALEKNYDFYELKKLAISKGMEVNIQEDYSYLSRTIEDAAKYYKLGMELKAGDDIKKGPLSITVTNSEVKITGPYMRIKKYISEEESYEFTFSYLPDNYLKPGIQVIQNGSCDFEESYVKEQVINLLNTLNVESDWVNMAKVEVNSTASIAL